MSGCVGDLSSSMLMTVTRSSSEPTAHINPSHGHLDSWVPHSFDNKYRHFLAMQLPVGEVAALRWEQKGRSHAKRTCKRCRQYVQTGHPQVAQCVPPEPGAAHRRVFRGHFRSVLENVDPLMGTQDGKKHRNRQ